MDDSHIESHRSWKTRATIVPTFAVVIGFLALVVAFIDVFVPPLQTRFVSDTFDLLESAKRSSLHDVLANYLPSATSWYRPTTSFAFALEVRAFGTNPFGYHLVALACQVLTAGLIFEFVRRLTGAKWAALLAGLTFLFCPQLHEPLWDVADLHTVLSGPVLVATLLAYQRRWIIPAVLFAALALTVDEAGVLLLGLIPVYECLVVKHEYQRAELVRVIARLAPFVALGFLYAMARMLPGHLYSEVANPCSDRASCLLAAVPQYLNRLFLRPDEILALTWTVPKAFALLCLVLGSLLLMLRPWAWSTWRPALFAVAWIVGGSLMFILNLWPYFDDRFMYVADLGFAILVGCVASEAGRQWRREEISRPSSTRGWLTSTRGWLTTRGWPSSTMGWLTGTRSRRTRLIVVALVFFVWFGSGIPMLAARGQAWIRAGQQAEAIVNQVHSLLPDPPSGSVLVFMSLPGMLDSISPGKTGPYVFHNGLAAALRLAYGHGGFSVRQGEPPVHPSGPVVVFDVQNSIVTLLGPPTKLVVSGLMSPRSVASAGSIQVTAVDVHGHRTKWYRGTVHFTSTDPSAKLPPDYKFTPADAGTHNFPIILETAGNQTVTATDTKASALGGGEHGIVVK